MKTFVLTFVFLLSMIGGMKQGQADDGLSPSVNARQVAIAALLGDPWGGAPPNLAKMAENAYLADDLALGEQLLRLAHGKLIQEVPVRPGWSDNTKILIAVAYRVGRDDLGRKWLDQVLSLVVEALTRGDSDIAVSFLYAAQMVEEQIKRGDRDRASERLNELRQAMALNEEYAVNTSAAPSLATAHRLLGESQELRPFLITYRDNERKQALEGMKAEKLWDRDTAIARLYVTAQYFAHAGLIDDAWETFAEYAALEASLSAFGAGRKIAARYFHILRTLEDEETWHPDDPMTPHGEWRYAPLPKK